MPKGEKIRPKQDMDQLPLENFEKVELKFFSCLSLVGRRLNYGEKGEFFLWSISLGTTRVMSQQVCFDLEIGNWGWFAKTNQVVAKNDPYMPNLIQNKFVFSFELMLHFF
jgi:hypothetical protein